MVTRVQLGDYDPSKQPASRSIEVDTGSGQLWLGRENADPIPLIAVRIWRNTVQYFLNDAVLYQGGIYVAKGPTTLGQFLEAEWTRLGSGGPAGTVDAYTKSESDVRFLLASAAPGLYQGKLPNYPNDGSNWFLAGNLSNTIHWRRLGLQAKVWESSNLGISNQDISHTLGFVPDIQQAYLVLTGAPTGMNNVGDNIPIEHVFGGTGRPAIVTKWTPERLLVRVHELNEFFALGDDRKHNRLDISQFQLKVRAAYFVESTTEISTPGPSPGPGPGPGPGPSPGPGPGPGPGADSNDRTLKVRFVHLVNRPTDLATMKENLRYILGLARIRMQIVEEVDVSLPEHLNLNATEAVVSRFAASPQMQQLYEALGGPTQSDVLQIVFTQFIYQVPQTGSNLFYKSVSTTAIPMACIAINTGASNADQFSLTRACCVAMDLGFINNTLNIMHNTSTEIAELPPDLTETQALSMRNSALLKVDLPTVFTKLIAIRVYFIAPRPYAWQAMRNEIEWIYGRMGIKILWVFEQNLDRPGDLVVDAGAASSSVTAPQIQNLYNAFKPTNPADQKDILLFFVNTINTTGGTVRGVASFQMPIALCSTDATHYTAAHEIGHVLQLVHSTNTDHFMVANTGTLTNPPPDFTAEQQSTVLASPYLYPPS